MWFFRKKECPECLKKHNEAINAQNGQVGLSNLPFITKPKRKRIVEVRERVVLSNTVEKVKVLLRDAAFREGRTNLSYFYRIIDKPFQEYILEYLIGVPDNWYIHIGEYKTIMISFPKWFGNHQNYIVYDKEVEE